jgi:hypothetical protein
MQSYKYIKYKLNIQNGGNGGNEEQIKNYLYGHVFFKPFGSFSSQIKSNRLIDIYNITLKKSIINNVVSRLNLDNDDNILLILKYLEGTTCSKTGEILIKLPIDITKNVVGSNFSVKDQIIKDLPRFRYTHKISSNIINVIDVKLERENDLLSYGELPKYELPELLKSILGSDFKSNYVIQNFYIGLFAYFNTTLVPIQNELWHSIDCAQNENKCECYHCTKNGSTFTENPTIILDEISDNKIVAYMHTQEINMMDVELNPNKFQVSLVRKIEVLNQGCNVLVKIKLIEGNYINQIDL